MQKKMQALLAASLAGLAGAAAAGDVAHQARVWAATCAACHSASPVVPGPGIPAIAGRDPAQLHAVLLEFKNGQRPAATVMHQHARGYSDDELRRIAQAYVQAADAGRQPGR